jgi:cytochrome c-type biogenesis protein CcmE
MVAAFPSAQAKRQFTGTITDSMCPEGDHSRMRMGATDAECTLACVDAHGASFVLYDGKSTYTLSDQKTPEKFAGQKVTVTGTLDNKTNTIRVESIVSAK